MPITIPGGSGGGAGFTLGPPTNIFTGADKSAAETARDTYASANAAWLAVYDANSSFFIRLDYGTTETFQARNGTAWFDVSGVVQGDPGAVGAQGEFVIFIHTNASSTPTPATPTGGTYDLSTGVLTPPTGTTIHPTVPSSGEDIYASEATINPKTQTGTVTPTWSAWVERAHLSSGISHVEATDDFTGTGVAGDPLGAADTLSRMLSVGNSPTQTGSTFEYTSPTGYTAGGFLAAGQFLQFGVGTVDSPDDTDTIVQIGSDTYTLVALGGLSVKLHEIVDDTQYLALGRSNTLTLMGPTDGSGRVVDITDSSLPAPDDDASGKIYINRRIPAAWMIHEVQHAATPVIGTFGTYTSPRNSGDTFNLYRGAHGADPTTVRVGSTDQNLDSRHLGAFYWNWRDNAFRVWTSTFNQQTSSYVYHWQTSHHPADRLVSGGTGVFLGHAITDADLLRNLPQDGINTAHTYVGVATNNTGNGVIHIRTFDNSTYVAAVDPFNVYDFVTIGLYGSTGTGGQTASQVQALIDAAIDSLIDSAPSDRNTLNELSDAIDAISTSGTGISVYSVGSSTGRSGNTITFDEPTEWPSDGQLEDGDLVTFSIGHVGTGTASGIVLQIGSRNYAFEAPGTNSLSLDELSQQDVTYLARGSGQSLALMAPMNRAILRVVTLADTLTAIQAGSNIGIDRATSGQITISSTAGGTSTGVDYGTGSAFPASPETNSLFEFTENNVTISAFDFDGTTAITVAERGDVFKYNGSNWVKQSSYSEAFTTFAYDDDSRELLGTRSGGGTQNITLPLQLHFPSPGSSQAYLVGDTVNPVSGENDTYKCLVAGTYTLTAIPFSDDFVRIDRSPHPEYSTGTAFTSSPDNNDLFEFNADTTGITAKDYNGSDDLTSASRGDLFKYNGTSTDWVKQSESGLAGSGGLSETQVDARITALVAAYALMTGSIAVSDLPSASQNAVRTFSYSTSNPQRLSYTEVDGGTGAINLNGLAALAGAVFTGQVSGITPTAAAHLARKDYVDGRVTDTGLDLATPNTESTTIAPSRQSVAEDFSSVFTTFLAYAQLTGATFTGAVSGITPSADNHLTTKAYVDGRTSTPTHTADQYVAIKATNTFVAADFTGANGVAFASGSITATIPDTITGNVYFGLARLDSDPEATYLDVGNFGSNQIGGTTIQSTTVEISGSTYEVRVSNNAGDYGGSQVEYR